MLKLQQNRMQKSNNVFLPKLKLITPSTTKARSSYSHLTNQQNRHVDNVNNLYRKIDNRDSKDKQSGDRQKQKYQMAIKQSRSKSSNFSVANSKIIYKYVSKSPQYFKKKQRSLQTLQPSPYLQKDTIPMQKYIDERMRQFNKKSLINLAKQGMLKNININYKHRIIKRKKQLNHIQLHIANQSPKNMQNQTKYSTFNPPRIVPLMHSLKKVYPSQGINY